MRDAGIAWFHSRHRKQADRGWMVRGLCNDPDIETETFFRDATTARAICAQCPVAHECRTYAYETEEKYGIWGGVDFSDWTQANDPRLREAFKRIWRRSPEGSDVRKAMRRLSDSELAILAAQEDLI